MRYIYSPFMIMILTFCVSLGGADGMEDEKFNKLVNDYLEFQWKLSPLSATFNGIHTYDDQIESFSIAEVTKSADQNKQFAEKFKVQIDRSKLNDSNQIDYDLIFQSLDAQEFGLKRSRDLERDPNQRRLWRSGCPR